MGEQVLKAFQYEKYSQIPDFCTFDEKVDNSFQRDAIKLEHMRMKMLFDGMSLDNVEVDLAELKYLWDRGEYQRSTCSRI